MTQIDKSQKLIVNEFQKSITEVPLEVNYQILNAEQYNASGYQFTIKQPGPQSLLDTDIWMRYKIKLLEGAANSLIDSFENMALNGAGAAPASRSNFPANTTRFGFRSGNIMQRALQNFAVQINNRTINVQPNKFVDALNRLYVSNDQSEHEFSASGGRFDEGNHGSRTSHIVWRDRSIVVSDNTLYTGPVIPVLFTVQTLLTVDVHTHTNINLAEDYYPHYQPLSALRSQRDFTVNMRPDYPLKYPFYNPGYDERVNKMIDKLRTAAAEFYNTPDYNANYFQRENELTTPFTVIATALLASNPSQFKGNIGAAAGVGGLHEFTFEIYERLPLSLFKMYSNDERWGVIPNVVQMTVQGNFLNNLTASILRSDAEALNVSVSFANLGAADCQLYLKWYTPPQQMVIPREITIPYKKINVWSKTYDLETAPTAMAGAQNQKVAVSEYNITLEAIPDLLLIFMHYNPALKSLSTPDDYNAELVNLQIGIDNATGKLNQIKTIDLYNKWKKLLKHGDNKIIGYDEWRKYCCVAALQPEDYGVRYGPGYSNQTTLSVTCDAYFWNNNPSIQFAAQEFLPNNATRLSALQLEIVSIFERNALTIRSDGSASEELLKVSADFNRNSLTADMQISGPMNYPVRAKLTM